MNVMQEESDKRVMYPYTKQMLQIMQNEYEMENNRKKALDDKAAGFITVNIAILTVFLPLFPLKELRVFFVSCNCMERMLAVIGLIVFVLGVGFMCRAFALLVKAVGVSQYSRVNLDSIIRISAIQEDECDISCVEQGLVSKYYDILRGTRDTDGNQKTNTQKADKLQKGIVCTVTGFVLLFLSTILLRMVIGG